jgi:uncharacterized protein YacL
VKGIKMKLEDDYVDPHSERRFESIFAVVTGTVGGFFLVVAIWFARTLINNHRSDSGAISFLIVISLIAYWFFKLTYKLALHRCTYLLSTIELKVTGWLFILCIPLALLSNVIAGQSPNLAELIPCAPAFLYGYFALKVAKKRVASSTPS